MDNRKIICIDFDGVIHSYTSGWKGVDVIPDPPVEGAIEWLVSLMKDPDLKPVIYSSRSKDELGIAAMQDIIAEWVYTNPNAHYDGDQLAYCDLEFPTQKPAAFLTIDDRAIQFTGGFPSIEEIKNFKPWNKKPQNKMNDILQEHPIGQFFTYDHLPEHLKEMSKPFAVLAEHILHNTKGSAEQSVALRKLLEAKDCAVRALLITPREL